MAKKVWCLFLMSDYNIQITYILEHTWLIEKHLWVYILKFTLKITFLEIPDLIWSWSYLCALHVLMTFMGLGFQWCPFILRAKGLISDSNYMYGHTQFCWTVHCITLLFQVALTNHKAALQSELARMKVKAGAKNNKELLPEAVRNEGTIPFLSSVNTWSDN